MEQGVGQLTVTVLVIIVLIAVILLWNTVFKGLMQNWVTNKFNNLAGQSTIVIPVEDYFVR